MKIFLLRGFDIVCDQRGAFDSTIIAGKRQKRANHRVFKKLIRQHLRLSS